MSRRIGCFGVWYYGVIVRGPFATRKLARKAADKIKETCTCDYPSLKIGAYEKEADRQMEHWTHPSVLALLK